MGKSKSKTITKQHLSNGKPNPRYVDTLDADKPLAGQEWGCFSFISPEREIKQREMFYFEHFLRQWELNKSMEKFEQFLNFLSYKYKLRYEDIIKDFQSFIQEEKEIIVNSSVENDYKNFLDKEEDNLQKEYDIKHNFQTSVRGFKSRGNFSTKEEAELRAKLLRESDPNHNIFVGQIGYWLPWDPEPEKTGEVNYMEEELNQLAHEKKKNEQIAKNAFDQRVREAKEKAIADNKKNAEKYGNVTTQDIDSEGNLVGTDKTFANKDPESITVADIRSELFDVENVVVGKTDYGQSQLLSGPFANVNKTN